MQQKKETIVFLTLLLLLLTFLVTSCGPTVTKNELQQTVTVNPSFQNSLTPLPTVSTYRCGAWASNNAPSMYSTMTIFARLTKNVAGVSGATASGVVHFTNVGDVPLETQPVSDNGGYVSFPLSLAGRQPNKTPATVSVTFTIPGVAKVITCSLAFFTPQ